MNVQSNPTSGRPCQLCYGAGYTADPSVMTRLREPTLRECECSTLRAIACAMPPQVRMARVSEMHLPLYHQSHLADIIERPGHRSHFVLVRGAQADVNAVVKVVHIRGQWRFRDQVHYVTDKDLADARYLTFNQEEDEDESPYAAAQTLLARAKVLVITVGVAQSKGAQTALLEAMQLRLQAGLDCWILSTDEAPIERSMVFSPELQVTLGRFKSVRIGEAAATPGASATPAIPTSPRTSVAKYAGVCTKCGGSFGAGDKVSWTKPTGGQRVHPGCAQSEA